MSLIRRTGDRGKWRRLGDTYSRNIENDDDDDDDDDDDEAPLLCKTSNGSHHHE